MPKLRSRGRQRKPSPNLSPQDENLEDQDPASLDEIKDEKRKADSELDALCTQINYLLYETDFDKVSIRQAQDKLVKAKEKIFSIMTELRGVYRTRGEHRKADDVEVDMDLYQSRVGKVLQDVGDKLKESAKRAVKPESDKDSFETENLQKWLHGQSRREFEAERFPERTIDETPAQTPANLVLQAGSSRFLHSKSPERKMEAGTRSNLERITVPKFNGDKTKFERFWTAFSNCVDKGCESSEIKMLRLESCLVGKAADTLEGLDYSETAYATAKMRLQRKFGGPRRQVQNQIEKLRSMKPLHADNVEDLEKFSDALGNIVVLLQTQGKLNELQPNSSLYTMSLEKIPEEMLSQYYRWLGERRKPETLEVFKDWILDETDYRVKPAEAIKGLKPSKKRFETHLGMVKHADQSKSRAICRFCKTEGHEIWKCDKFKALHTDDRWKIAKDQALCFRCLSNTHKGSSCRRFRECGIDGCKSNHHRLLHAFRQPPNPSTAANNSTRPLPAVEDDPALPSATGAPTIPTIPTISPEGVGVVTHLPMDGESSIQRAHTTRKWLSNSTHVLKEVPQEDRLSKVDFNHEDLPSTKTLGVVWIAETDVFTFDTKPPPTDLPLTKRNVLKNVATLFDPLGLVTPYTIRAKILLQVMWTRGLDWDEGIDGDLTEQVQQWFSELDDLKKVQVHRCLQPRAGPAETTIHTFVDASKDAFGAVSYVRNARLDGVVETRFIASKTKVAPLATMSIPRLELSAAVMGLRLAQSVSKVLQMAIGRAIFWSDSTNTLWWIRGNGRRFKPFVANRVGEIQAHTDPFQWRYVPTSLNPADLCTRGSSATRLAENTLWWDGPSFLKESEELWPRNKVESNSSTDEELKRAANKNEVPIVLSSITTKLTEEDWRLKSTRFSSWTRLTRIHAWILRFVQNCQLPTQDRKKGELSPHEILEREGIIIKEAQKESFPEEYRALTSAKPISKSSKIIKLTPRLDEDGIIRCDGRLKYTEFLPFDVRFPIILPRGHWVTKLIVKQHHELGNHAAGTNHTLANLSARYWIVSTREEIREWENQCNDCKKRKGKAASQVLGPLPKVRLRFSMRAFAQTAVDYGGPFITIQGRGKARLKRWLCLFTCLASRAIHCEMAFGLDTDSFLNAFARMAYRRGLPQEVVSDRGTNFIGANRELKELVEKLDKDKICQRTANQGVTWIFNPPQAPHFGGAHEIMIKAAKKAIHAVLGEANVTDEELMTAFIGAESLLNSRPITYQTANPCDETPLTPNHFLYGQVGGTFAPDSVDETEFQPKRRWRRVQELISHFWRRWLKEWLPSQNVRSRWNEEKRDLKVGDVVLAISSDLPRAHWPLGRITEIYPGKDNHVRIAKVQVGQNSLLRPINKLIHLDVV